MSYVNYEHPTLIPFLKWGIIGFIVIYLYIEYMPKNNYSYLFKANSQPKEVIEVGGFQKGGRGPFLNYELLKTLKHKKPRLINPKTELGHYFPLQAVENKWPGIFVAFPKSLDRPPFTSSEWGPKRPMNGNIKLKLYFFTYAETGAFAPGSKFLTNTIGLPIQVSEWIYQFLQKIHVYMLYSLVFIFSLLIVLGSARNYAGRRARGRTSIF